MDYALLCHGHPQISIEAKRRGVLDVRAEEQLFGYASNQGVPLPVPTDGDHWDFFLSMADGFPEDRRFCRLKSFHKAEIPQYMESLELTFGNTALLLARPGAARKHALQEKARRCAKSGSSTSRPLPRAWRLS